MDPQRIFALVTTGAAVLAIAAVVIVYLKGSVAEATIKQLKENFAAMKDSRDLETARADKMEKEIEKLKAADILKDQQIKTLQEVVTNKAEIQKLLVAIDKHHSESMRELTLITQAVTTDG